MALSITVIHIWLFNIKWSLQVIYNQSTYCLWIMNPNRGISTWLGKQHSWINGFHALPLSLSFKYCLNTQTNKATQHKSLNVSWTFIKEPAKLQRKKLKGLNPTQRTAGHRGKIWMKGVALPRKEHTHWLSSTKWSALKTYIQVTLYAFDRLYWGIDMYIQILIWVL